MELEMYMEEEAREKWCPHTMVNADLEQRCVASHCMAWRWDRPSSFPGKLEAIKQRRIATGEGLREAKAWVEANHNEARTGYCGLAGRPE